MSSNIQYLNGDATSPYSGGPVIIAHICNDLGGWGRGFVLAINRRWKKPELEYRAWYGKSSFALGKIQVIRVEPMVWVANMIAQHGFRSATNPSPIRYDALRECLGAVRITAKARLADVHMPRIGCGLAGGKWEQIESIIEEVLSAAGVSVTVYDYE